MDDACDVRGQQCMCVLGPRLRRARAAGVPPHASPRQGRVLQCGGQRLTLQQGVLDAVAPGVESGDAFTEPTAVKLGFQHPGADPSTRAVTVGGGAWVVANSV
ncbi:MAG: hypothetical protein WDW36_000632 [Sanguina aurantia]